MLTGVAYRHEWAKLHPRVNIEKETIVTKDIVARHQDCWILYFVLAFDFDCRVVEAECSFDNEVQLSDFVRWFAESEAPRWRLNILS